MSTKMGINDLSSSGKTRSVKFKERETTGDIHPEIMSKASVKHHMDVHKERPMSTKLAIIVGAEKIDHHFEHQGAPSCDECCSHNHDHVPLMTTMKVVGTLCLIVGAVQFVYTLQAYYFFTNVQYGSWWGAIFIVLTGFLGMITVNRYGAASFI